MVIERQQRSLESNSFYQNAVSDFIGKPFTEIDEKTLRKTKVREISYNDEGFWLDPFFDFLFRQLDQEDQITLLKANQPILQILRKKPGDPFKKAVHNHAENFHHGAVSFTELELVNTHQRQQNGEQSNNSQFERESFEEIKKASVNSIKFYPLTEDENTRIIIDKINKLSDSYEFIYDVFLTVKEITSRANLISLGFVLAGLPAEEGLKLLQKESDFLAQIVSQLIGEAMVMGVSAGDRAGNSIGKITIQKERSRLQNYFGLAGQALKHLPDKVKNILFSQAQEYQTIRKRILSRLSILATTLITTIALSHFSQVNDSMIPYSLIPFLNTSIINLYEIWERGDNFKNHKINEEDVEKIIEKIPSRFSFIKPFLKKRPAYQVLAISDFLINNYAVGGWLGSLISSFFVLSADLIDLSIPKEWIYALSGVMIENVTSLIYGILSENKDPYQKFIKFISNS